MNFIIFVACVAFFMGAVFGAIIALVLRPKNRNNDIKLAQYDALLSQQKQDIETLRL